MLYAMLWYVMIWYYEWEFTRLYAMSLYYNATVWDSNAMLRDLNHMLYYGVCGKRYAWLTVITYTE